MKKVICIAALLAALLLSGCEGNPLPAGMEEEALLAAGRQVVSLVVQGDYEGVWALLREDVQKTVSVEDIQSLALSQLEGTGVYKQIEDSMVTGQSEGDEAFGVAVLYCQFEEEDVLVRAAFDPDMVLIGLEIKQQ